MVPVRMATNKESTGKSTIDLIFAMSLLSESLISCKKAEEFDHDLDHQLVISKWMLQTIDRRPDSRRLLTKIDKVILMGTLNKGLANMLLTPSKTADKLDKK